MDKTLLLIVILSISSIITPIFIILKPSLNIGRFTFNTFYIPHLTAAILIVLTDIISGADAYKGVIGNDLLSPAGILVLFFSMAYISIFLDYCGFFDYCARLAVRKAGTNQVRLFIYLYSAVSILTVFTSNDIIILTVTPFVYYFSKEAKINPLPYLIAEFFAANTWSMLLMIGNPTNILIAEAFQIGFFEYFKVMVIPTLAAGLINFSVVFLLFKKSLKKPILPLFYDSKKAIKDLNGTITGLIVLIICIVVLSISGYINIKMWIVSAISAAVIVVFITCRMIYNLIKAIGLKKTYKNPILVHTFKKIPWGILPFTLSLFIIITAVVKTGLSDRVSLIISIIFDKTPEISSIIFGFFAAITCNLINNIPASVFFIPLISNVPETIRSGALYSAIASTNLSANITPLGALAGIMWQNILKNHGFKVSFLDFVKYGTIVTLISLSATLILINILT